MNVKTAFGLLIGVFITAVASTSIAVISSDGRYAMVTGQSANDPTYNAMESETSMTISPLRDGTNNAVAMVTYNDDSNNGTTLQFTKLDRTLSQGASAMGWSYVVYDQTQSFSNVGFLAGQPTGWTYGGKVAPPSGWAVLWGDPSSTAVPGTNYVLISNIAIPTSKYPGPIVGNFSTPDGGACIALSADNGRHFVWQQCVQSTTFDGNGDIYDGSSMASTLDGKVFAAYNDVQTHLIDVWSASSATGTFVKTSTTPFPGLVAASHPRLRAEENVILIAAIMANPITGQLDLFGNVYTPGNGQWATPTRIALNVVEGDMNLLQVSSSFIGLNNQTWRHRGMFSFDVGRPSQNGDDLIRVAVTVTDSFHGLQVQTYRCVTNGGQFICTRTPEWDAPTTGVNFSPVVRATASSGPSSNPTWALVYQEVYGSDLVQSEGYFLNVESNGTRDIVPAGTPPNDANGTGEKPWWPQGPCPSIEYNGLGGNTYQGDYDDLQVASESWRPDGNFHPYFFATETNTRIPSDLSGTGQEIRCTTQWQFSSAPQHVAVNMFAAP